MIFTKDLTKIKKFDIFLILFLLSLAFFFRLWGLKTFQYWSDDEQLLWSIIRHIIVDRHPSLVTPNAALGIGLGPLFHYLITPWLWLVNLNPEKILLLGNLFTFLNIILLYITGVILGGKKVGFIASFLYGISFISSLFDRRLWALSPNFSLVLISIISLIQIIKGKSKYIILLIIPLVFSLNSDPTLGVAVVASILTFMIFKPQIQKGHILWGGLLSIILLSPLIVFELRHSGQNIKSLISLRLETDRKEDGLFLSSQIKNFSRFFLAQSSDSADAYFCYCKLDDKVNPALMLAVSSMMAWFTFITIKKKDKGNTVLLLVLISYLIGMYVFKTFLGGDPSFFYSMTISPVLFLIAANVILKIKYLPVVLLPILLLANFYVLSQSSFKYPLSAKMKIVKEIIKKIPDKSNFSLYYSGDILGSGGGWTALFISQGFTPSKGSLHEYWGHIYNSYNLYPIPLSPVEPDTVVTISEKSPKIYNNKNKKFNPKFDVESLYQPKYFK